MSIWSTFCGSVTTHPSKKISIKTLLKSSYDDEVFVTVDTSTTPSGYYCHRVEGSICLDDQGAWDVMSQFFNQIKTADPSAVIDITVSIRCYR